MGDRHGWNSWNEYQSAHEGCLRHYATFFVASDTVEFEKTAQTIYADGTLYCLSGIEIAVRKTLETRTDKGRVQVRTAEYSYHVMRRVAGEVTNLFRYDNIHLHAGHRDKHHKHIYREDGTDAIQHVGYDNWPTLAEVIEEAHTWWSENITDP